MSPWICSTSRSVCTRLQTTASTANHLTDREVNPVGYPIQGLHLELRIIVALVFCHSTEFRCRRVSRTCRLAPREERWPPVKFLWTSSTVSTSAMPSPMIPGADREVRRMSSRIPKSRSTARELDAQIDAGPHEATAVSTLQRRIDERLGDDVEVAATTPQRRHSPIRTLHRTVR